MIRATELSMRFADLTALERVSFEARPGEVLGFLGPNGAGKTTTMRILTGYLPPSLGRVEVCGIDLGADSKRARARIGYLPESLPLYPEMRVEEYLSYRAALKGLPARERAARVDEVVSQVGIAEERRRIIGQLSKGFRQRVGLADALVHRPEVLILDEPTDGLDPNQRREVLRLISELGKTKAVVLSTHILPEVDAVCSRVVILDHGKLIAEGRPSELGKSHLSLVAVALGAAAVLKAALLAISGVTEVTVSSSEGDGEKEGPVTLRIETSSDLREAIAETLVRVGKLRELRPASAGIEELFARVTRSVS